MTVLDTKLVFLFDEKDYLEKVASLGKKVSGLETIEYPCPAIAVVTDKEVHLTGVNLYEENGNWLKYRRKRKAAVYRREKRNKAQSK